MVALRIPRFSTGKEGPPPRRLYITVWRSGSPKALTAGPPKEATRWFHRREARPGYAQREPESTRYHRLQAGDKTIFLVRLIVLNLLSKVVGDGSRDVMRRVARASTR
jgi:hypothetical protein